MRLNNEVVEAARFKGDRCAISIAAASLLTELIVGAHLGQIETISNDKLLAALESDIQPTRVQCALLPLEVLRQGVKNFRLFTPNPR